MNKYNFRKYKKNKMSSVIKINLESKLKRLEHLKNRDHSINIPLSYNKTMERKNDCSVGNSNSVSKLIKTKMPNFNEK